MPLQAHRAGRGHLRPLRQPGAGHPPRGVRRSRDAAAVRSERGEAQHGDDREVRRHGRKLDEAAHNRFLDLLNTDGFAPWFSTVTPLTEIGLLPIGSRPAKRGLGAKSLDDLRTIPWIFSWAQARINLAAWYGLGTACEQFGDLNTLRQAYEEWPLFSTFIDNIEMSLAKTDERIAKMYLALGDREDLNKKVLDEMELTRKWVLKIVGDEWPLQHRHVLGQAIRIRSPYVDALSVTQVLALARCASAWTRKSSQRPEGELIYLILCTVSGVAAGLQNTG